MRRTSRRRQAPAGAGQRRHTLRRWSGGCSSARPGGRHGGPPSSTGRRVRCPGPLASFCSLSWPGPLHRLPHGARRCRRPGRRCRLHNPGWRWWRAGAGLMFPAQAQQHRSRLAQHHAWSEQLAARKLAAPPVPTGQGWAGLGWAGLGAKIVQVQGPPPLRPPESTVISLPDTPDLHTTFMPRDTAPRTPCRGAVRRALMSCGRVPRPWRPAHDD